MVVLNLKMLGKLKEVSFDDIVSYFYQLRDPSSLGIIRFLFGLLMMLDLPEERGGSDVFKRYGNPQTCHFPLFDFIQPLSYEWMSVLYGVMWLGTLGIMFGFRFRISILMFVIPYWYLFLLDKSFWNNHTYLYGIVATLLVGTSANNYCSIDSFLDENIRNKPIPYWNYFILKFQFFMLYFLAGLKKTDWEWLEGYSMREMGSHWVFLPFSIIMTPEEIDYLIIHWFGFILDLTIGFWMLIEITRPVAMIFCALFHLMNSRMFSIGMFPYVCLATMPLFCQENWPRRLKKFIVGEEPQKPNSATVVTKVDITWKKRLVLCLLVSHCMLQTAIPFSHSITKGYNNWTKGLYGYSWDMMIHGWDTILVVVKIVDNVSGKEHFLDSYAWTTNDRWTKHADMCLQYARCIERNLEESEMQDISKNISVYIDVWCSMNGRIQQRMFDPNYDLLKANWSVFKDVEWLLPLISEYSVFRKKIEEISQHVYSWSNFSEVIFVSDFHGLYLENYINNELTNVSLTILEGEVLYESEETHNEDSSVSKLIKGATIPLSVGQFHRIFTISEKPSFFMYTYVNSTRESGENQESSFKRNMYSPFPLLEDMNHKILSFSKMFSHINVGIRYILNNY